MFPAWVWRGEIATSGARRRPQETWELQHQQFLGSETPGQPNLSLLICEAGERDPAGARGGLASVSPRAKCVLSARCAPWMTAPNGPLASLVGFRPPAARGEQEMPTEKRAHASDTLRDDSQE